MTKYYVTLLDNSAYCTCGWRFEKTEGIRYQTFQDIAWEHQNDHMGDE